MTSSVDARMRAWRWRVLGALAGCYVFYYTGRLAIGHALPLVKDDLGYTKGQLGWLTAAALTAYGVGQAINGNLGDRVGGRLMVTLGALGSMALCWSFSFMHGAVWLVVLWAANGYVQSMGWAPGGRLISNWWPHQRRGLAFGIYMLAAASGTVLVWCTSFLVLRMFPQDDPSRWRWLFRIPLVALGVSGVLFYWLVRDRPQDVGLPAVPDGAADDDLSESAAAPPASTWLERYITVLGNRWFLLAALVIVFQSFSRYALLTWIVPYYEDSGVGVDDALLLTVALPIGMGLGAVFGGYASDRWFSQRRAMVVAIFLAAGGACFLAMSANPVAADADQRLGMTLLFLAGFFIYGAQGPLWAMCPDLVGKAHAGTAVGLMDALAYAGAAAQGPILGYIADSAGDRGYRVAFLLLTVVACAGATLALASATAANQPTQAARPASGNQN